jgi:sortase A
MLAVLGLLLLSLYASARIYSAVYSRAEVSRFWKAHEDSLANRAHKTSQQDAGSPDFRLWSEKRIAAYQASLRSSSSPPLAVLQIASLDLEVPILEGTDDLTLDRGVGHIEGTTMPGEKGNVGIAGHRDGFFRVLKDVHPRDIIELDTHKSRERYQVDEILIVAPEAVSVLGPRSKPSLTLVTCYPFYFVGSAPQRFIVHASLVDSDDQHSGQAGSAAGKGGSRGNY